MSITKNLLLNWYSSMKKKIRKIRTIFDCENWIWKSDLCTFCWPMWTSVKVKSKKYFYFCDFFAKIQPLLTHVLKNPPLRSRYPIGHCIFSSLKVTMGFKSLLLQMQIKMICIKCCKVIDLPILIWYHSNSIK